MRSRYVEGSGIAMSKHWGTGPVFAYEWILNARRRQVYVGRSVFVLLLLIGLVIVWAARVRLGFGTNPTWAAYEQMAKLGEWFFYTMAGIQVSLALLAAPASTAGSICIDRARGTLAHMMVTDLSDAEIVLGKLGARLAPIMGLIACGVPVAALVTLLGGVEIGAIVGLFVVTVSVAVIGCVLSLTISVWAAKTHDVLMAVYMILALWLLALPIWGALSTGGKIVAPPAWFEKANPFVLVFSPYVKPGRVGVWDYALFAGAVLLISAALVVVVIARLRRVVIGSLGRPERIARWRLPELKRFFPSWPSPTLDGNPVLWREWHRNRPSKIGRRLWATLLIICWSIVAWGTYELITGAERHGSGSLGAGYAILLVFGMLMLSATAPTALAEERARGSLDVLLATPLSTRSIVLAKWWGAYRRVLVLAVMTLYVSVFLAGAVLDIPGWAVNARFAKPAVPLNVYDRILAVCCGVAEFLVSCAVIVSLGLALATWVRRLNRAIVLSVIAYFLTAIVWAIALEMIFFVFLRLSQSPDWPDRYRFLYQCAQSMGPIAGPMKPVDLLTGVELDPRIGIWIGIASVIVIKATIAWLLLWLTIKTFDRCVGRMPESGSPAPSPSPAAAKELALAVIS
jgi:ABC-type transport system involved in multi-copper enzyme maturation permease subunit